MHATRRVILFKNLNYILKKFMIFLMRMPLIILCKLGYPLAVDSLNSGQNQFT